MEKNTKIIIAVVVAVLAASGCICFSALTLVGIGGVSSAIISQPKTYYPECEPLEGEVCKTCCNNRGHSGYVSGAIMNDNGQNCGCI